jgi:hypothetical protein
VVLLGHAIPPTPEPATPKRSPAHYLWAVLIARIYEVFPLLCPKCGGQMRLIAFITEGVQIRKILDHIGVDSEPPHISPARGPPLWDDCDAQTDDGVAPGISGAPLNPLVNSAFCGGSARHGLAAGAARVSTQGEGSSTGQYLASGG